jgi:hypothetical protein
MRKGNMTAVNTVMQVSAASVPMMLRRVVSLV